MEVINNSDHNNPPKTIEYQVNTDTNPVSSFYRALGVLSLIIGGIVFFVGIANGTAAFLQWLMIALFFVLASIPTFVVAEIVQILHDIRAKLYENSNKQGVERKK